MADLERGKFAGTLPRASSLGGATVANAEWTRIFFGEHSPKRALSDVMALESIIIRYIMTTRKVDRVAALSFVPYAGWVAFATLLNAEIARRNPDAEKVFPRPSAA